jgi:predicted O-methyltransferase YrrM
MMDEHFQYNNTRTASSPQYFNDPISRVSCPKWEIEDSSVPLKTANLSPWRDDWNEYLDELGIDVFKMHGREDIPRMFDTMTYIERYVGGEEILAPGFMNWADETGMTGKPIEIWRDKIKNCKFDCWECKYCDKIYERKSELDYSPLVKHVVDAIAKSGVPKVYLDIPGLTSPRVQTLLNHIASGVGSYLEIGSYLGATAASALKDNSLNATFIDTWNEDVQDKNNKLNLPPNSKETFEDNITPYIGSNNIKIIQADMFDVQTANMTNTVQMFFYDGPHDYKTTYDAISYYYSVLANEAIIIVDDANWKETVDGTINAINDAGGRITYKKLMLNSEENMTEWWNGLYVAVIRK